MAYSGPTNGSGDNPDPNMVPGFTVQGSAAQTALGTGIVSPGYAQENSTAATSGYVTTGNGNPGAPGPVNPSGTSNLLENAVWGCVPPSLAPTAL